MSPHDGTADLCSHFQLDLSCLVDGELDEVAAARAMVHLEDCPGCSAFFDEVRESACLHRDIADPERLFARIAMLTGSEPGWDAADGAQSIELVHRLATVFYKLGKAYVLAATDPDFRERVFEAAVPLETTRTRARGFVDGVLSSGDGRAGGVDWTEARTLFNGRLERIQSPLEKGRRLLDEALRVDPTHEEARLYLAWLDAREGRRIKAERAFREIFETAVDLANRGHAAIQLGRLHSAEQDWRNAIRWWRWVTITGLADQDGRFFVARFNLGMVHALAGDRTRALSYFRTLLDRHPERVGEVAELFARSPKLREAIDRQSGFAEELVGTCPELFGSSAAHDGSSGAGAEEL
jgi:tetratricopeptide (TPR) repeat protein